MWGKKANTIRALLEDVKYWQKQANDALDQRDYAVKARDEAQSQLVDYIGQVGNLTEDLAREHTINVALADENRDLAYQLELYKAVLGQLTINVKLPVKKVR